MKHISNENIVAFDCDETLILWHSKKPTKKLGAAPYSPHTGHIDSLKRFHSRGQFVIVWSAGGAAWAKKVIKVLGISKYVHLTMAKPKWMFDDLPLNEISTRCYYKVEE